MENQLTWDEYRVLARRTQDPTLSPREKLAHAVLGLCSELHEADVESSALIFGSPEFINDVKQRLALEIGDCYWMIAELCDYMESEIEVPLFSSPYRKKSGSTTLPRVGEAGFRSCVSYLCGMAQKAFQGHKPDNTLRTKYALSVIGGRLSVLAEKSGFDTPVILHMNIEKLKKRYPDGFSADRSVNRED